ncbi:MAG: DAK2 domain-containing protein [Anaerolineae bacterium]
MSRHLGQESGQFSLNGSSVPSLAEKYPPRRAIKALDGEDLRTMLHAAQVHLARHRDEVNALNVFPVPDGDTGTNMLLTMQAACQEITSLAQPTVGHVMERAAHGALMGARGNSGVILSQILRGMARALDGKARCTAQDLARALEEGTETAYKGVSKPVEGTILTVIRRASEAAQKAVMVEDDIRFLLEHVVDAASEAVDETPRLLPVLAQAGVVDSGGKGLQVVLEGMLRCLEGTVQPIAETAVRDQADLEGFAEEWGYDIQYLILADNVDEAMVRKGLRELGGESIMVGSSGGVIKVHVHGEDPGPFLSFGASLGHLDDIVVENMTLQTLRRREQQAKAVEAAPAQMISSPQAEAATPQQEAAIGVVAVVPGRGLQEVFRSLGVSAVVQGGQTMNPSTQELLEAIEKLPQHDVIVLPNNGNVIMAAQQARSLSRKNVCVIPSRTIPQGISAMLALNPDASLEENRRNMEAALTQIETGEITIAVRAAEFDGIQVKEGDVIGLHNDELSARGDTPMEVMDQLLEQMHAADAEVITIYFGEPVTAEEAQIMAEHVRTMYPDQLVELIEGGQPHYHYIVSVE